MKNRFPQNDPISDIQKDLDLLTFILRSVVDQFSLVDDPDPSQLLIFSHFLQYFYKSYYIFQTVPAVSKHKTISSKPLSSLEPFHEVFDFENSRNTSTPIPSSQFKDLGLYTKQKMDEYLGSLLSADPLFFLLAQPTTLQATQSTPETPTQVASTLYPKIDDPPAPPPNLHQYLPPHLTTPDNTIFLRPPTPLF